MKLLGIISVGFDVIDQLLIKFFAFYRYWGKIEVEWDSTPAIDELQESLLINLRFIHPCSVTYKRVAAAIASNISTLFPPVVTSQCGRALDETVSRRVSTAEARIRCQVRSCGICGEQSGTVAGSLRVLRSPLPFLIPPTAPHLSSSRGDGTIVQIVVDVPSGLSLTPPEEI
jgi:hypothetical protein